MTNVSILMPSLNQAAFISTAIRSIIDQNILSMEILVMDGQSDDDTHQILATFSQNTNTRVRWWSESDDGPASAINKAFTRSEGNIIGWLNSDDVYSAGAISRAIAAFENHPEWKIVYGHGRHIDEAGSPLGPYPTKTPDVGIDAFKDGCFICQPTVFFRRDAFAQLGPLNEDLNTAFDLDLWLKAFSMFPTSIGFVDDLQASTRLHEQCITRRERETATLEAMSLLKNYFDYAPLRWVRDHAYTIIAEAADELDHKSIERRIRSFFEEASPYISDKDRIFGEQTLLPELFVQLRNFLRVKSQSQKPTGAHYLVHLIKLFFQARLINQSPLFDAGWYVKNYPSASAEKISPAFHYLMKGATDGNNPSPSFDTKYYLSAHPDVTVSGMNPLIHYLRFGRSEGRLCRGDRQAPTPIGRRQIIMHVGTDKTGSSAIQSFLKINSKRLETLGYFYPQASRGSAPQHHRLYQALVSGDLSPWKELACELETNPELVGIISFEGFYHLNEKELRLAQLALSNFDFKIIIYLRPQSDKLRSGIAQNFKTGANLSIDQYGWETIRKMTQNYEEIVDKLANVFSWKNIIVRRYETARFPNNDLISDFLDALNILDKEQGMAGKFERFHGNINPTLDVEGLHILDSLDKIKIPKELRVIAKDVLLAHSSGLKTTFVTDQIADRIDRRCRRSNRRLARKLFIEKELFTDARTFIFKAPDPKTTKIYTDTLWGIFRSLPLFYWEGDRAKLATLAHRGQLVTIAKIHAQTGVDLTQGDVSLTVRLKKKNAGRMLIFGRFDTRHPLCVTLNGQKVACLVREPGMADLLVEAYMVQPFGGIINMRFDKHAIPGSQIHELNYQPCGPNSTNHAR